MAVSPVQNSGIPIESPNTPASQAKTERASTAASPESESVAKKVEVAPVNAVEKPQAESTSVTLKHDSNGRVYYSVADAKSGQEILEVPPKALRDVGQGIEDYIKAQQSKATSHVKVKG